MKNIKYIMLACLVLPVLSQSQNFYLGESNSGSGAGNLYMLNSSTCTLSTIGAMGTSVSGLATDPSGNLFASEALASNGTENLLSINTTTGLATSIGLLTDGVTNFSQVPDLTFVGSTLYGWSEDDDTAIIIDTTTGGVTDLGNNSVSSAGSGLAANAAGTIYTIPCAGCGFGAGPDDSDLYTVDPVTGVLTYVTDLIDNTTNGDVEQGNTTISAMTFDAAGNMWGYAGTFGSSIAGDLVSINTSTGELLTVCSGLPIGIDALASADSFALPPPAMIPASTNWFIAALVMLFIGIGGLFGYKRFAA